ncbi:MAG: methylated-DNA--[protein]-cysteine S-methyltransferase [Methylovulum sp.]|nr:methylated-DNA--[protein]-cysteine S-methyltransferase [Methylovulum sp.]
MPFIIQWVDSVSGTQELISLNTPAGKLILSIRQDVITNADWAQVYGLEPSGEHQIQQNLEYYWTNPDIAIPVKLLRQGSAYRQLVWAALCQIPIGETMSYSALAKTIASAARAVGNACKDNPYPLFIPCHRIISASGMGGYCGQTEGEFMAIKRLLLAYEAAFKK